MRFTVGGHSFDLDPEEVKRRMRGVEPEPIRIHYVVVNGRRYPPKQVLATVIDGLDRLDYQTMGARRVVRTLGFEVGRA